LCSKVLNASNEKNGIETIFIKELNIATFDSILGTLNFSCFFISKVDLFIKSLNEISKECSFKNFDFIEECDINCFSLPKLFESMKPSSVELWIYAIMESIIMHKSYHLGMLI